MFGAIIGMAKDDIKKALAASTMSQIGYMILAAGLGPIGYAFAIMHLLTHGFFKAGMFLGAGSVMHGMNDEVNMRRYGGLARYMPITTITFGLGYLAIIGVPPFAGFYSKDKIIEAAFNLGGTQGVIFGSITLLGAVITAFYMTRVFMMTFLGKKRWAADAHPHESPFLMWMPMVILSIGSVASGFLLYSGKRLEYWLKPVVDKKDHVHEEFIAHSTVTTLALTAVAIGVVIAVLKYRGDIPTEAPEKVSIFTKAARRDLFQDEINESLLMRPGQALTQGLVVVDEKVIDGAVRAVAGTAVGSARGLRRFQTGYVRNYALLILIGVAVLIAALWVVAL
jgi:NADH-quinone oxidoreductase subunit L